MNERWCNECGQTFVPRPQSPRQTYCSQPPCQLARKLLWQRTKRRSDKDYAANQAKASTAWAKRNPDYWKRRRVRSDAPQMPLNELATALIQALWKICEDAWATDTGPSAGPSGNGAKREPPLRVERSPGAPGSITFTLKIELGPDTHMSSSGTRQETT